MARHGASALRARDGYRVRARPAGQRGGQGRGRAAGQVAAARGGAVHRWLFADGHRRVASAV